MRRFFVLLMIVAISVAFCVAASHAQTSPGKAGDEERTEESGAVESEGKTVSRSRDEGARATPAADTAGVAARGERAQIETRMAGTLAGRLIPVWKLSPTGVRIRSVHDRRNVIIIFPPPALTAAPVPIQQPLVQTQQPPEQPARPAAAALLPPAQVTQPSAFDVRSLMLADSAFRASVLTRGDMAQMEARLQSYLDKRLYDLQQSQQLREARRESLRVPSYPPERTIIAGPTPGAANVILVPVPSTPGSPLDTAKLVADIAARLAEAQSLMLARAESLALVSEAAADSARSAYRAMEGVASVAPAGEAGESEPGGGEAGLAEVLPMPGPEVVEVERAILETGMLRAVTVLFEANRADLLPVSASTLDALGRVLEKHAEVHLEIRGHTDSRGPAEYNLQLSRRRAESVRDYLVKNFSIDSSRLVALGYGEAKPIASDATATGRALNRRVEFVVVKPEGSR